MVDGSNPLPLNVGTGNETAIYFEKQPEGWRVMDTARSHPYVANETGSSSLRKRHDLQGPIDDAFMQPFVCVLPTGTPWQSSQADWARWTLERFQHEFDHRMRAKVPVVNDVDFKDDLLKTRHLILFGDPGSNSILARLVGKVPIHWTKDQFEVRGQAYRSAEHGLSMIYPNPLNPQKYVVLNSGHTFHEQEFSQSNANLFPKLGDIGVIKFASHPVKGFSESVIFSDIFDSHWKLETN